MFSPFVPTFLLPSLRGGQDSWPKGILGSAFLPVLTPLKPYSTGHSLFYYWSPVLKPPMGQAQAPRVAIHKESPKRGRRIGSGQESRFEEFWERPGQLKELEGNWEGEKTSRNQATTQGSLAQRQQQMACGLIGPQVQVL